MAKVDQLPDTLEEAEIFMGNNIKSSSEIAAQIATNMTLKWNDTMMATDVASMILSLGMAVVKRSNDPNYGIKTEYVDPSSSSTATLLIQTLVTWSTLDR